MVKQKLMFIVVVSVLNFVNVTGRKRQKKLFSFNNFDGEISVDLDFSIPFISIPVKQTMDTIESTGLTLPTINVNVAALALGGAVVLGTVVVLPLLIKSTSHQYSQKPFARLLYNAHFGSDFVLGFANQLMMDSGGLQRCALRIACWTGQRAPENDVINLMHQVSGNRILSALVNATAVEDAIMSGRRGKDCSLYKPCPLKDEHLPFLLNNLRSFSNQ